MDGIEIEIDGDLLERYAKVLRASNEHVPKSDLEWAKLIRKQIGRYLEIAESATEETKGAPSAKKGEVNPMKELWEQFRI